MDTFGEYLRTQREKKGIRLEEIASITKIHIHSLQYLEKGNWSELPPEPFIRGFIIAYAKYVGLDPKEVLERFALENGKANATNNELETVSTSPVRSGITKTRTPENPEDILRASPSVPVRKIVFATTGIAVLVVIGILISLGKESSEKALPANQNQLSAKNEIQPASPTTVQEAGHQPGVPAPAKVETAAKAMAKPPTVAEAPKASSQETPHELSLETKERSWTKIVIDEKAPVEFYSIPGKVITYKAKTKLKLVLGNSTGSVVSYNGQVVEGKRLMGTIRFFIFPEGARFPQDTAKRATATDATSEEITPTNNAPAGETEN